MSLNDIMGRWWSCLYWCEVPTGRREEPDVSRYDPFLLAEDHLAETVNELQIGLVRAHSLAIRDLRKWYQKKDTIESSDPRVVFSIKGRPDIQLRSTVREKTLSPAWAESFELELMWDEIKEDPTLHHTYRRLRRQAVEVRVHGHLRDTFER